MRVLLTVPSLSREFGGPARKARALTQTLRVRGAEAHLVGAGRHRREDGVTALGELGRFHGTPIPARLSPLRKLVKEVDVVHVLGFRDPIGTLAAFESRSRNVPYVLEPTGMFRRRLQSHRLKRAFDSTLGRPVIAGASAVIATSDLEAADLSQDGIPEHKIRVRPNGVRVQDLLPLPERGQFRKLLDIPDEQPLVLTIARIGAAKGLTTLVRATAGLSADVHVVIAGPDDRDGTLEAVRSMVDAQDIGDRVRLLVEGIWGDVKRAALTDADVFCLPSDFESFGTAAVEAASCGLPVVTTSTCGAGSFLDPGSSRLVAPGDSRALAHALLELMDSHAKETAIRSARGLRERLDWATLASQQLEIYDLVID